MKDDSGLFDRLLRAPVLIKLREPLRGSFMPSVLPGRKEEARALASLLVPALLGDMASNVLVTGPPGSGKTSLTRFVCQELHKKAQELEMQVFIVHVDCAQVDTHYRLLSMLANHFIEDWSKRIPFTGWPTEEVLAVLQESLKGREGAFVIVLDGADHLVSKSGAESLYALSQLQDEMTSMRITIVSTALGVGFEDSMDTTLRRKMHQERVVLGAYDSAALISLLRARANLALEAGAAPDDVLGHIAASSSGDAAFALGVLRCSAELAEREHAGGLSLDHVKRALAKVRFDTVADALRSSSTQHKLVLLSTIIATEATGETLRGLTTGEVYAAYTDLATELSVDVLTQRRFTDLLSELQLVGVLSANVVSKGRYGRTKEIRLTSPRAGTMAVLGDDPVLGPAIGPGRSVEA